MKYVVVSVLLSVAASVVVTKIIAAYHFRVIDSYLKDLIEEAKKQIRKAATSRCRD